MTMESTIEFHKYNDAEDGLKDRLTAALTPELIEAGMDPEAVQVTRVNVEKFDVSVTVRPR